MCGILSIYSKLGECRRVQESYHTMLATLRQRGPDETNLVQMGSAILGHTRLSIIDVNGGSQPLYNEDKTVAVICNGEIYNFADLRRDAETKGHIFKTNSDTEVIVHLYEDYGDEVFSKLNGMFSIIIYDLKINTLLAARDRIGEKPLLYWNSPDLLIIASELKAIIKYPNFPRELDMDAISLYFNCGYIPAPYSIFKKIKKLLPGHFMKVGPKSVTVKRYWSPVLRCRNDMKTEEAVEEFHELFSDSVKKRLVSDVPLGIFLSGGIDSSAVVAFASQHSAQPLKTFSVGFADEIDERPYARLVADRYKTDHTEIFIDSQVSDVVEHVSSYFDEPFADSSAIPTYLVSRAARQYVKVVLTGDGGDELFAGYPSYLNQKYQTNWRYVTALFKRLNQFSISYLNKGFLDVLYPKLSSTRAREHWLRVREFVSEPNIRRLVSYRFDSPAKFLESSRWLKFSDSDPLAWSYAYDMNFYLVDNLLKKVDMASMFCSLECRAPFLDHRLIEFAFRIPPDLKVKNDTLKHILKESLTQYLPPSILHRQKIGFGAPIESWLQKGLKTMVLDSLAPGCYVENIIHRDGIQESLADVYDRNTTDYRIRYKLWLIFNLELWMRTYFIGNHSKSAVASQPSSQLM